MYPEEKSITSAFTAGSDVSVVFKHKISFVLGNLWSLFYCSIDMFEWKWKQAMFDIILCFIVMYVRSLNCISAAINMFKWKWKEAVVWKQQQIGGKQIRGKKHSWDILFQVISVEKRLVFHRTNHCLGCVGYTYVGWIYQNRGETLLG